MNMIERFSKLNILVIGDVMLDRYLWGDVERISPEAPVPVLHIKEKTESPGGAGNVVSNLVGLGCNVSLISVCGDDEEGQKLLKILSNDNVKKYILLDKTRPTITKTRAMARSQQLLRIDEEKAPPLSSDIINKIINLTIKLSEENDAIILSDYGKGVLTNTGICEEIIHHAKKINKNVFIDPKGKNWDRYCGATCVTPNVSEMELTYGEKIKSDDHLLDAMKKTIEKYNLSYLLVTRGEKGMGCMERLDRGLLIPAVAKEVYDVSGAGDTVIATLTAAMTAGFSFYESAKLANIAAGIVVGKVGTQPITQIELETAIKINGLHSCATFSKKITSVTAAETLVKTWKSKGKKVVFTNGCFDIIHPGHIHLLNSAKRLGDYLIVGLNSDESIKRLKGDRRPFLNERERASILGSLDAVDLIILFNEDTPNNVLNILKPDILVKGNDYKLEEIIGREIVESYGGKVHLIPIINGYSTTALTELIKNKSM